MELAPRYLITAPGVGDSCLVEERLGRRDDLSEGERYMSRRPPEK